MKLNYLLSMLFGGMMLAACSVDDDLSLTGVEKDVNPSAPVFAISFDDDADPLTRAIFDGDGIAFEKGKDLMSLYHGITESAGNWAYQNAVYQYDGKTAEGVVQWNTAAMVLKGNAIMIYPADTKFDNEAPDAPKVTIEQAQTEENLKNFPYMSAVMDIADMKLADNKNKTEGVSGYNKLYKVIMKPAASVLNFVLATENDKAINDALKAAGVSEVKIEGITLENSADLFTTSIPVKIGNEYDGGKFSNDYPYWVKKSELDISGAEQEVSISSEYKTDATHLKMAMLPFKTGVSSTSFTSMTMKVETTYGSVSIAANSKNVLPTKEMRDKYTTGDEPTLSTVFGQVVYNEVNNTSGNDIFEKEYAGHKVSLQVTVDLTEINMTEKHVKTGEEMHNMLKVLNALKGAGETPYNSTLYLDGKDGVFEMNDVQLKALMDQRNNKKVVVEFVPCNIHGLQKVRITNTGIAGITEIPEFGFDTNTIPVELVGEWTYKTNTDATKALELKNITSLTVGDGGTLTLKGTVQTKAGSLDGGLIIAKGGNVIVEEDVLLNLNTKNSGKITIGETNQKAALTVTGVKTLENCAAAVVNNQNWAEYGEKEDANGNKPCGVIDNYGSLSADFNSEGSKVVNYGVINAKHEKAMTLVTENAAYTNLGSPFAADNKVGSIYLFNESGSGYQTSVGDNEKQGFIKWIVTGNKKVDSTVGTVANYIIVEGADASAIGDLNFTNSKVKYLEIRQDMAVNKGAGKTLALDALIVKKDATLNVPSNEGVKLTEALYNEGVILFAGKLIEPQDKSVWQTLTTIFGTSKGAMRSNGGTIEKAED